MNACAVGQRVKGITGPEPRRNEPDDRSIHVRDGYLDDKPEQREKLLAAKAGMNGMVDLEEDIVTQGSWG